MGNTDLHLILFVVMECAYFPILCVKLKLSDINETVRLAVRYRDTL